MDRYLVLENGKVYKGEAFGAGGEVIAELVFTTAMTGYVETLTDPSYKGQTVIQTFPLIGNYGIMKDDKEGDRIGVSGYIVREACDSPSNFRCEGDLDAFLRDNGIPGIKGIDTRALTRLLRESGTMNCMICDDPSHADIDAVGSYRVTQAVRAVTAEKITTYEAEGEKKFKVALIDYGTKKNIIRCLQKRGCEVTVFPASSTVNEIRGSEPDGIFLSNGPGDPAENTRAIDTLRELNGYRIPTMGICLGHQLLALSHGFTTEKLKYGHRGANHPVKDTDTGRIYITSQNHGYAVVDESIDRQIAYPLFVNVNDGTNEGLAYRNEPSFSVQFHPEACGGPKDSELLFDRFIEMMERGE